MKIAWLVAGLLAFGSAPFQCASDPDPDRRVEDTPAEAAGGSTGRNGAGTEDYKGPCPPSGTHRYFWKVYALDTDVDPGPGTTAAGLEKAMRGHVLAYGELMGTYSRP